MIRQCARCPCWAVMHGSELSFAVLCLSAVVVYIERESGRDAGTEGGRYEKKIE